MGSIPLRKIETTYCGKPLSEHTKEELIKIINEMAIADQRLKEQREREMDIMMGTR